MFCVPIRAMVRGVTEMLGLSGYQWARPPDQPLDPLPEAERHAALVTIVDDLVGRFGKTAATTGVKAAVVAAPVEGLAPRPGEPRAPARCAGTAASLRAREETLEALKRAILHQPQQRFGISAAARTGIHGRGGLGKTVLATALAHDPEIRQAFPDGVYWVTLGQQPSLLALQTALARQAGGTDPVVESVPQGTSACANCSGRSAACWYWTTSGRPARDGFHRRGTSGRLLVTTRDRQVLTGLGAETHELDALDPSSALLAAGRLGRPALPLPAEAARVAKECGHLPLALALAGARYGRGSAGKKCWRRSKRKSAVPRPSPRQRVQVDDGSSGAVDDDAARYCELAIFPEDVAVPESVIAKLWSRAGLDALATTKLLLALDGRGLLRCTGEPGARTVTFHDLQGDFLR